MNIDFDEIVPPYLRESHIYNVNATDMVGNYIYVNRTFQERFSFISENLLGSYSMDTIYEGDHPKCFAAIEELIAHPRSIVKVELRKPSNAIGVLEWTHWEFSMLFDESNEPIGVLCIGFAITKLKDSLAELAKKNQKLQQIAHTQAHGMRGPLTTLQMVLDQVSQKGIEHVGVRQMLEESIKAVDDSINEIVHLTVDNTKRNSTLNE